MAKKIGIPSTTFNRLINGYSQPNLITLSKLIKNIPALKNCLPEQIKKAFEVTLSATQEDLLPVGNGTGFVKESAGIDKKVNYEKSSLEWSERKKYIYEEVLSDKDVFLCYMLAQSKEKITKEEVRDYFGQKGVKALNTLVEKKLLLKKENSYYVNKDPHHEGSFRLLKKNVICLAKQYDPDDVRRSYIHGAVEGLNEKGMEQLLTAHRKFHKTVLSIMQNKDNKGDKPFFSIACSDFVVK